MKQKIMDLDKYKKQQVKAINWRMAIIIGGVSFLAITAILIGLGYLHIGVEEFYFSF